MKIAIGSDHAGFELKEYLKKLLADKGYELDDLGAETYNSQDDYPEYGRKVAEAVAAAEPLIRGTVENIGSAGVPNALTGPIARGDVATVTGHLRALDTVDKKTRDVYRALGVYTVDVARRKGRLKARQARELMRILQPARG